MRSKKGSETLTHDEYAIESVLLAGKIMMRAGAETYRVEDTMERIAKSQELTVTHSFVTPTAIIFSPGSPYHTKLIRIKDRATDLEKVALVNDVSRKLTATHISIEQAYHELVRIEEANVMFPLFIQVLAGAIASGAFLLLFGGEWSDAPYAMLAGGIGFFIKELIETHSKVQFFAEFVGALFVALTAFMSVHYLTGQAVDTIIIGGVMPLVPGLLITNAVRDLMAGHFMAGLSKGAEAFLTAFAIGAGVALVLSF